jgi:hypothetical protein
LAHAAALVKVARTQVTETGALIVGIHNAEIRGLGIYITQT